MEFLQAYALTLAVESIVLYGLLKGKYPIVEIVKNSILASTITLPFVWFVFPLSRFPWFYVTAASEIFAVVIETGVYRIGFRKISWEQASVCSLICNTLSFSIGLALN